MHKNAVIIKVEALRCIMCEHVWLPRVRRPFRCPRCWAYVDGQTSGRQLPKSVAFGAELSIESSLYPTRQHQVGVEFPAMADLDLPEEGMDLVTTLDQMEAKLLLIALRRAKGKRKQAAQLLRLSCCKLRYKIHKHGIEAKERDGAGGAGQTAEETGQSAPGAPGCAHAAE